MFEHSHQLRVRYRDVDAMGIVYYSHYLEYFEAARDEMMRDIGLPYGEFERQGFAMPVVEAHCTYHQGARFDDLLTVVSRIVVKPQARLKIEYEIFRPENDNPIVSGFTVHAFTKIETGRPVKPPRLFLDLLDRKMS
jgi:acyl-CoA thioester hydrolase